MELPGTRKRGKPHKRFMDVLHEEGWGDRGSRRGEGEMEADDLLWPPLKKSI